MNRYVIKSKKFDIYFKNIITKGMLHCVRDVKEAKVFKTEEKAQEILDKLNITSYEIKEI